MNVSVRPKKPSRRLRADNEFLPAALEILETPASPIRAAMIWFVCLLAVSALIWSYVGTFDIVATAQGKIQPAGRVKVIQSLEMGKTVSLPAQNGLVVKAGDVLVQMDDTEFHAEETALATGVHALQAEVLRRTNVLESVSQWRIAGLWNAEGQPQRKDLAFSAAVPVEIRLREQQIYEADLAQLYASMNSLIAQRHQRKAAIDSLTGSVKAQEALVTTLSERVSMRSALLNVNAGTRANLIDAIEMQQKVETDLAEQRGQLAEASSSLNVTTSEAEKLITAFSADYLQKQADASRRCDELTQELIKVRKRRQSMTITSPIDGTVQASAVTTVGQVLAAGFELMRIVPGSGTLEIEAYLPNRDIGFVAPGQSAVLKIEAFPFTRYGVIEGRVTRVATDAIPEPDAQQMEGAAAQELRSSVLSGNAQRMQNLVFQITVVPEATTIEVDGKSVPLSAGMAATVEIKTGKRRIIEYLFSPLVEITSQSMIER